MKRIRGALCFMTAFAILFGFCMMRKPLASVNYPTNNVLSIANLYQYPGSYWCTVTCVQIVLRYYGVKNITQQEIFKTATGKSNAIISEPISPEQARGALYKYGVTAAIALSHLTFPLVVREIGGYNRPIIASLKLNETAQYTLYHSVVVYGYSDEPDGRLVWFHTPAGNGSNHICDYQHFVLNGNGTGKPWEYSLYGFVKR